MTDRPIIFSAPMIRALLDGRKTQTRRIIKPSPEFCGGGRSRDPQNWNDPDAWGWENYDAGCWDLLSEGYTGRPFYAPRDRLWVREAFATDGPVVRYRATDDIHELRKMHPSIHMPRRASRLTLLVTDVRVQRLQEISRGDAMEEGCPFANMADGPNPRDWYRDIWNTIHGPDAWDANPWCAAISFDVKHGNIDDLTGGGE
jgi:hypothetical protein